MPQTTPANPLNALLDKTRIQVAMHYARLSNWYTPFGFNPEPEDMARVTQLHQQHGPNFARRVFGGVSPAQMERVASIIQDLDSSVGAITALKNAGAEGNMSDAEVMEQAAAMVFSQSRAGQQAEAAHVD